MTSKCKSAGEYRYFGKKYEDMKQQDLSHEISKCGDFGLSLINAKLSLTAYRWSTHMMFSKRISLYVLNACLCMHVCMFVFMYIHVRNSTVLYKYISASLQPLVNSLWCIKLQK